MENSGNNTGHVGNFNPDLAVKLQANTIARFENRPSPMFPFSNASMSTGTYQVFDFTVDNTSFSAYAPFTNLKVVNTSTQPIYVYFGEFGSYYDYIPASSQAVYEKQDMGGGLSSLKVYNAGSGTISAGQVLLTVYKEGKTPKDVVQDSTNWLDRFKTGFNKYRSKI